MEEPTTVFPDQGMCHVNRLENDHFVNTKAKTTNGK